MGNSNIGFKLHFDLSEVPLYCQILLEASRGQIKRLCSKISCDISFMGFSGVRNSNIGFKLQDISPLRGHNLASKSAGGQRKTVL